MDDPLGSSLIICRSVAARSVGEGCAVTDWSSIEHRVDRIVAGFDQHFCASVSVESSGWDFSEDRYAGCTIFGGSGGAPLPSSPQ
jgi:hypothetical protein